MNRREAGKRLVRRGKADGKETVLAKQSGRSNGRSKDRRKTRRTEEFEDYSIVDPSDIDDGPDVLLDVPIIKVDEVDLEVDDLRAQVAVHAQIFDLVQIGIGADAQLGQVELNIKGVEAQALLKARLHNVAGIVERVVTTLDRNPDLIESVGHTVEEIGSGAGHALDETGDAVEETGEGAGGAIEGLGRELGEGS